MLIDAFLWAGEREMLDLRFRTLRDFADVFVVVMCDRTHQNAPVVPPVTRAIEVALDAGLPQEKLRVNVVTPAQNGRPILAPCGAGTAWYQHIERQHRAGVRDAVRHVTTAANDIVLVSDVDEIPAPAALAALVDDSPLTHFGLPVVFEQRFHSTAIELLHPQQPWLGTVASYAADLWPQETRDDRGAMWDAGQKIEMGGWHLSWMGSDREREEKLHTFSHQELVGRFDPMRARLDQTHANGEPLRQLDVSEMLLLDWPGPIDNGTWPIPSSWRTPTPKWIRYEP